MRGNSTPSDRLVAEGAEIETNLAMTQYSRVFDINGHQAGVLAIRPYGNVPGSVSTDLGALTNDDSGLGDVMLGFVFGLCCAPDLSPQQYVKYDPDFAVALLAKATLPTGSYDSNRTLHMGEIAGHSNLELRLCIVSVHLISLRR